jgi:hypothetical protein
LEKTRELQFLSCSHIGNPDCICVKHEQKTAKVVVEHEVFSLERRRGT